MKYLLLLLLTGITLSLFAQGLPATNEKPSLDTIALKYWIYTSGGLISDNGEYVSYTITDHLAGTKLVVQKSNNDWKKKFDGASMAVFTHDNRWSIFKSGKDSIGLLALDKGEVNYISSVNEYKISEDSKWLAYRLAGQKNELVLQDLYNGKEQQFTSVSNYLFTENGKTLLLEIKKENTQEIVLQLLSLQTGNLTTIWSNAGRDGQPANYVFDTSSKQLAFIVENKIDNQSITELWYHTSNANSARLLVNNQSQGISEGWELANLRPEFSRNGKQVFFYIQAAAKQKSKPNGVLVDVWSYTDTKLQSQQFEEARPRYTPVYTCLATIDENEVTRLEQNNERIYEKSDDYILIKYETGQTAYAEANWNLSAQLAFYLVSTRDGSRKLLKDHISNFGEQMHLSPTGKWVTYYDFQHKNYFCYEVATGKTCNATKNAPAIWTNSENDCPEPLLAGGLFKWLANDDEMLIGDGYDIWQVDPAGIRSPVNITNGYGRAHHIIFRTLNDYNPGNYLVQKGSILILTAFDKTNKNRGFYTATPGAKGDPELNSMGPFIFNNGDDGGMLYSEARKAKDANIYLVTRMSAVEAPNFFITKNLKDFVALTDVQPQKNYNWLTSELVHWKTFDGGVSSGILYKPENFDPRKKYPVIFYYYEILSDGLNQYITPSVSDGRINISWFVSRGYLVFTPDIHYKIGEAGQSACNSVVSAAAYLATMPWVDSKRMGLQGHSFGAYETNYIITHSKLFAAACSASGVTDIISRYCSANRGGYSMYHEERIQGRIGATLWQRPDLYIKNSPIFKADRVSTPLLMMSNKADNTVLFPQGIEFFTALRRLGKKVWMLQYDDGGHSVGGKSAEDFTTRMTQFFDHYLKGAPAPRWMVEGIPAKMKGIDNGLELMPAGVTPGPGLSVEKN
jgi:dienelactone hydrolase